jgi:hypothetical protein
MQQEAVVAVVAQELRQSVLMEARVQQQSVEQVEQVEMAAAAVAVAVEVEVQMELVALVALEPF